MRSDRPSTTARIVAETRATLDRPEVPTGDAEAESRLYRSLAGRRQWLARSAAWHARMERRTRFFDVVTLRSLERGVTQVAIVAAGYDGRPLRFATPGVTWFEVDHPSTQADKRSRIESVAAVADHIRFVPIDLNEGDLVLALSNAGFRHEVASVMLVEGLLGYLHRPVIDRLLTDLRGLAAPGSRIAVAFPTAPTERSWSSGLRHRARGLVVRAFGEPWVTRFTDDEVDAVLARAGWRVTVVAGSPQRFQGHRGVLILGEPDSEGATAPTAV